MRKLCNELQKTKTDICTEFPDSKKKGGTSQQSAANSEKYKSEN